MAGGFNNVPPLEQQLTDNIIGGNIGGIISTRPQAKYVSGARVVLRINNKPVLFAFKVGWHITTSYNELAVIDNYLPEELVPKHIRVSGSIAALHIPGFSATSQLWQPDVLSFLFHQYITIEVRDSVSNELLFYAPKAAITSRREDISVDDLAQVSLSFVAIGFQDEKTPSLPKHVDTLANPKATITGLGDKTVFDQHSINPSDPANLLDKAGEIAGQVAGAVGDLF